MTRNISFLLLAFFAFNSQAQNAPSYTITGTLNEDATGYAYLVYSYDNQQLKDSTKIVNGEFSFTGQSLAPEIVMASLKIPKINRYLSFFLENKEFTVSLNKEGDLSMEGSIHNDILRDYYTQYYDIHRRAGEIYKRLDVSYKKIRKETGDENAELPPEVQELYDAEFAALLTDEDSIVYSLARKNPGSIAIPYLIVNRYIAWNRLDEARDLYVLLTENAKKTVYEKQIVKAFEIDKITAVGATAPDFTMDDINGKPLTLSSLRGKYVFVDFWASWCGPCRKENPSVVKVYEKYHDKGLEILGVSLDEKKDAWLSAIEKDKLTWLHVSDLQGWKNAAATKYGITTVPSTYLLDKEGKVIARNLRAEELKAKLAELLD